MRLISFRRAERTDHARGPILVLYPAVSYLRHGLCCLLASARAGARLTLLDDTLPFALQRSWTLELIERERVAVFPAVPFLFRLLAEHRAGEKVGPIEVQDVVARHPDVREAVVVGVPSDFDSEELVKAVVVPTNGCAEQDVIEFCRPRLARFEVPSVIESRDEIRTSPLGKVLGKYLV